MLFAELPDRLHAEVVGPLGSTHLILDAGDGTLSVTAAKRGVAWVGAARPEVLADLVGVPLTVEQLVRAVLLGEVACEDCRVERTGSTPGELPERLEVGVGPNRLALELKKLRGLGHGGQELGRGRPPDGVTVYPLEEIDLTEEDRALTDETMED